MKFFYRILATMSAGLLCFGLIGCVNHTHKGNWVQVKAPTCEEAGLEKRICTECNEEETKSIDAIGHDWKQGEVAASCSEEGFEGLICGRCGKHGEGEIKSLIPHNFGAWQDISAADCYTPGERQRECSECHYIDKQKVPYLHNWEVTKMIKEPNCTEAGLGDVRCIICGTTQENYELEALGHEFSSAYTLDVKATKTEPGSHSRHCVRTGCEARTSIKSIPALSSKNGDISKGEKMYECEIKSIDVENGEYQSFYEILSDKKAIIVNFYFVGCHFCEEEFPDFIEAYNELGDKKDDVVFLLVDIQGDTATAMKNHRDKFKLPSEWILSENNPIGEWLENKVTGAPVTLLVDSEGILREQHANSLSKATLSQWFSRYVR